MFMQIFRKKHLFVALCASVIIAGCASTDPYSPQSDNDFKYDNDMSFAMNVIDGSLGFHNGLRDANRPSDADATPGTASYAADAILGFGNGGGLGGAFLSMLGTNQGNKPLHTYYGIVYYPVEAKGNIQNVYDNIDSELINAAVSHRNLQYIGTKANKENGSLISFKGEGCLADKAFFKLKATDICNYIHYENKSLLRYSKTTPDGKKGLFAVIGYEGFYTGGFLSLNLDEKYYIFSPVIRKRTKFPFVSHDKKIHLFIKPSDNKVTNPLNIEQIKQIDPWIKDYYQG
jgi:hypothetical protein